MINNEEMLCVVDENNNVIDPLPRSVVHREGQWHRTAGIWVVNRNGLILCQQRSMKKDRNPGKWEPIFGGHVLAGESYEKTIEQELYEELGIVIDPQNLFHNRIIKDDTNATNREFQSSNVYITDKTDLSFEYEKDEIENIEWKSVEDIETLFNSGDVNWSHKPWDQEILSRIKTLL